ncbi:MAG: tetratricopeptide repeat protein [Gammaproteobacteria bacterium]|nr:tetratricopeptide repeat protein [Gammaproteobacteria bacterium]
MKYVLAVTLLLVMSQTSANCNDDAEKALLAGNVDESISLLTDCLESDLAGIARTWLLLGEAREEQGRTADALEMYARVIDLDEDDASVARAAFRRGLIRKDRRQYDRAETDLTLAIERDPELAEAYFWRARILHRGREFDAALADYTRAIDLDDQHAKAYYYRAAIYRKRNLDHLAIEDYYKATEIDPNFVRAHANRTFTYLYPLLPVLLVLFLG